MGRSLMGSWLGFDPGDADDGPDVDVDVDVDDEGDCPDDEDCDDTFGGCGRFCSSEKAEMRLGLYGVLGSILRTARA